MVKENVKTVGTFVNNMSIAVFGYDNLIKSTITGRKSNRSTKIQSNIEQLDQTKIFTLKSKYVLKYDFQ